MCVSMGIVCRFLWRMTTPLRRRTAKIFATVLLIAVVLFATQLLTRTPTASITGKHLENNDLSRQDFELSNRHPKPKELHDSQRYPPGQMLWMPPPERSRRKPGDELDVNKGLVRDESKAPQVQNSNLTTIAIGCAVTTRHLELSDALIGQTLPFFRTFLSSFCKTASTGFDYHIYIAYDIVDTFFTREHGLELMRNKFDEITGILCQKDILVSLHFIQCDHVGHPAWAQNDAMMAGYLDNRDFYFRVNDDTSLSTPGWTEQFISALAAMSPTNVGVVGPNHRGGNEFILTHDFVHQTHLEIFGFYYPRTFSDWYADDWITYVYLPDNSLKVESVEAIHTYEKGTRYNHTSITSIGLVQDQIQHDRQTLNRYIEYRTNATSEEVAGSKRVISMSLYGSEPKYTYGAIRNAQVAPVIFPGWTLRFYMEDPSKAKHPPVPEKFLQKLRLLGAEIIFVDTSIVQVPPMFWRFLVADDTSLDYFIVRDADSRLSRRDSVLVSEWIKSGRPFHCVRDHPSHVSDPIYGGLWGAQPKELSKLLALPVRVLMKGYREGYGQDLFFLRNALWSRVQYSAMCHDSISCQTYPNSYPIKEKRVGGEHIGQVYDAHEVPRELDIEILRHATVDDFCVAVHQGKINLTTFYKEEVKKHGTNWAAKYRHDEIKPLELPPELAKVVIWTVDMEMKPVLDIKGLLMPHGVRFIDKSLSPDCEVTKTCATDLKILTKENAMRPIDTDIRDEFYKAYADDAEMRDVTHFLCNTPLALCELYLPFNKSMVIWATNRYEFGREVPETWRVWNRNLYKISWDQRNTLAANNHYDAEYIRYFSGMHPEYIPNYCGYSKFKYNRTKSEFLVMPIKVPEFSGTFLHELNSTIAKYKIRVAVESVEKLYPQQRFSELSKHSGIIHIPSDVSSLTMCEQYRMNIPLFFPSLNLLAKWHQDSGILVDRTLNARRKLEGYDDRASPIDGVSGRFDPNDEQRPQNLIYWLRFADYYQWPYIIHFDSVEHLVYLLQTTNLPVISEKMSKFNEKLKRDITQKWIDTLKKSV